jgi:sugar phosphate isomerase/epimerase
MDEFAQVDGQRAAIRAALTETGVAIACYDIVCAFATADAAKRVAAVAAVEAACGRAADLGAPHVLLIPAAPEPGLPIELVREHVAAGLRACLPTARRLGLTASIPNLGELAAYYGQCDVVLALLEAAGPAMGLTYDVGNWALAGEDPLAALARVGPRVAHVHLKDWRVEPAGGRPDPASFAGLDGRRYLGVALGEGEVDLARALAELGRLGYAGYLAVEYEGPDDPAAALRRGVTYARGLLAAGRS